MSPERVSDCRRAGRERSVIPCTDGPTETEPSEKAKKKRKKKEQSGAARLVLMKRRRSHITQTGSVCNVH